MKKYNYLITYVAVNNDTYAEETMTFLFNHLPKDIKKTVKNTYDGVWEPQLDKIKIYGLSDITGIMRAAHNL